MCAEESAFDQEKLLFTNINMLSHRMCLSLSLHSANIFMENLCRQQEFSYFCWSWSPRNVGGSWHVEVLQSSTRLTRPRTLLQPWPQQLKLCFILVSIKRTPPKTWWRNQLRHCATIRKVAGLIPDEVFGIFHGLNPSGRTMPLGLTQLLTEVLDIFFG